MQQFMVVGIFEGGITGDTVYGYFNDENSAKIKIDELVAQSKRIFVSGKAPNFKRFEIRPVVV